MKIIILVFTYVFLTVTLKVDFLGVVNGVSAAFDYFFNLFPDLDNVRVAFSYVVKLFNNPLMMLALAFSTIYFVMRITIGG